MRNLIRRACEAFLIFALFGSLQLRADAGTELITNGGFETGDFMGWTVTDQLGGGGTWFVQSGTTLPLSTLPTVGPAGGNFYAVTDQNSPGTHLLTQPFTAPASNSVLLSFDLFVNNTNLIDPGVVAIDPAGLDYTTGSEFRPNHHARVDLLANGSDPFDTGAGVLQNFYLGADPGDNPNPYTHYSFDITSLVGAGGTFVLRFAEVDNQGFLNQGVDNVRIDAQPLSSGIPEPSSLTLLALGTLGLVGYSRRLRQRTV